MGSLLAVVLCGIGVLERERLLNDKRSRNLQHLCWRQCRIDGLRERACRVHQGKVGGVSRFDTVNGEGGGEQLILVMRYCAAPW